MKKTGHIVGKIGGGDHPTEKTVKTEEDAQQPVSMQMPSAVLVPVMVKQ